MNSLEPTWEEQVANMHKLLCSCETYEEYLNMANLICPDMLEDLKKLEYKYTPLEEPTKLPSEREIDALLINLGAIKPVFGEKYEDEDENGNYIGPTDAFELKDIK